MGKKILHKLQDTIVIVLFVTLTNVDGWEEMEYFAQYREEYLRKYIGLKNGMPSHNAIQAGVWGDIARHFATIIPEMAVVVIL